MTKLLKNQVITSEGVQQYIENGQYINKLKTWDNLKQFIAESAVAVDGHPIKTLVDETIPTFGIGKIKACPNGRNTLCADIALDENAPDRQGYSIGYVYEEIPEKGVYNGQPYDVVQKLVRIDHIALTDTPRHAFAIKVSGDANEEFLTETLQKTLLPSTDSNSIVVKYAISFDSFKSFINEDEFMTDTQTSTKSGKTGDKSKNNTKQTKPGRSSVNEPNTDPNLENKPKDMVTDEEMEDEEEDTDGDTMPNTELENLRAQLAKVQSENATLKAQKTAGDAVQKQIDELKSELNKQKLAGDAKAKQIADQEALILSYQKEKSQKIINSLKSIATKKGMDEKDFDDLLEGADEKSIGFISKWQTKLDTLPQTGTTMGKLEGDSTREGDKKKVGDASEQRHTGQMVYNRETRQMEFPKQVS